LQHASQERELSLTRQYESILLNRDTTFLNEELSLSTAADESLSRLSHYLRMALRAHGGEDIEAVPPSEDISDLRNDYTNRDEVPDVALERECELVRLEKENEELRWLVRQMAGVPEEEEPKEYDALARGDYASHDPSHLIGFRAPMMPRRFKRGGAPSGLGVYNDAFRSAAMEWAESEVWKTNALFS